MNGILFNIFRTVAVIVFIEALILVQFIIFVIFIDIFKDMIKIWKKK